MSRRTGVRTLLCLALLSALPTSRAEPESEPNPPGLLTRIVWYLPNRVLDLLDVFRLRLKVGPGIGVGARLTDYGAFYAGNENTAWIGLPGPRYPKPLRPPWGRDQRKGVVLVGVDASDHTPHPPRYGVTEAGVGVHLGVAGVDAGFGIFEFVDFLTGWIGLDLRQDDLPRREQREEPATGSVLRPVPAPVDGNLREKPETFDTWYQRLVYLRDQAPLRIGHRLHAFDARFAEEGATPLPQPRVDDLQFALYLRTLHGPDPDYSLKGRLKLGIALPNLEQRVRLFIDSASDDDLPGRDFDERRDRGFTVGAGGLFRDNWYSDVGVHTRVPPLVFARTGWRPKWEWGKWRHQFDQRVFWESEDGFGVLTSQHIYRWVSPHRIVRSLTAGRFAEGTDGYEWQQTLGISHLGALARPRDQTAFAGPGHATRCVAWENTLFGSDVDTTQFRSVLIVRRPIFHEILVLEVSPGLQWRDHQDWKTEYRLDAGIVMFF